MKAIGEAINFIGKRHEKEKKEREHKEETHPFKTEQKKIKET